MMGQQRRRFSPEFKRDAVALHRSSGRSIAAVAKELGIGESNLGGWLAKDREQRAMVDPVGYAVEVAESEENKRPAPPGGRTGGRARDPETIHGLLGEGVERVKVYAFVDAQKTDFMITTLCRVCGVSTSGFYDMAANGIAGRCGRKKVRTTVR